MNEFYKIILDDDCTTEASATVGNTDFKQYYPAVNKATAWATLQPYIRQAADQYIYTFICEDVLSAILLKESPTDVDTKVIGMVKDALAYYAVHHAMPTLNIVLSDMGVQENRSDKSDPVPMWKYKNTRWETIRYADTVLDRLLNYISKGIESGDTKFDTFKSCEVFNKSSHCLFPTVTDLQQVIDIKSNYRTYAALQPAIDKSIKMWLKPITCGDLYTDICTKSKTGDLSADEKSLIEKIRDMVGNHALYLAIPSLRLIIEGDGIKITSSTDGMNVKKEAHDSAIESLSTRTQKDAQSFRQTLEAYIYDNATLFPLYKSSSCYQEISDGSNFVGCEKGGIFIG